MGYNLLRTIFPAREVMEIRYSWARKNPALLPVDWGVRILRYLTRIGKNNSPIRSLQIGKQRMKLLEEYGVFREAKEEDSDNRRE